MYQKKQKKKEKTTPKFENISSIDPFNEEDWDEDVDVWKKAEEIYINKDIGIFFPYVENGRLRPAKYIELWDYDDQGLNGLSKRGRYIGLYPIKPEHFMIMKRKTHNGDKTFFNYKLTIEGQEYLKRLNKNLYAYNFDLVDDIYVRHLLDKNKRIIKNLQDENEYYKSIL